MCVCTPESRTPFCGKVGCQWPSSPVDELVSRAMAAAGRDRTAILEGFALAVCGELKVTPAELLLVEQHDNGPGFGFRTRWWFERRPKSDFALALERDAVFARVRTLLEEHPELRELLRDPVLVVVDEAAQVEAALAAAGGLPAVEFGKGG